MGINLKVYLRFKVTLREIHSFSFKALKNVLFIGASQLVEQILFFCAFQVGGGKRESSARKRAGEGLDTLEGRSASLIFSYWPVKLQN